MDRCEDGNPESKFRLQSSIWFWSPFINSTLYCIHSVNRRPHDNICRLDNSCVDGVDGTVHWHRLVPWPDISDDTDGTIKRWATDGSSSPSRRSYCCFKKLQHPPTIVDNQDDGCWGERRTIVHLPREHLTGQRWNILAALLRQRQGGTTRQSCEWRCYWRRVNGACRRR